jgi:hypothetical protein
MVKKVSLVVPIVVDRQNVVKIARVVPLSSQQLDCVVGELKLYKNKRFWLVVSQKQQLEEWFIEKYADKVNWLYVCEFQKLSEQFIEKYKDKVNWVTISQCQKLSEQFIEKYKDKLEWVYICAYQKLSPEFIMKHVDRIRRSVFDNPCFDEYPDPVKLLLKQKFNE